MKMTHFVVKCRALLHSFKKCSFFSFVVYKKSVLKDGRIITSLPTFKLSVVTTVEKNKKNVSMGQHLSVHNRPPPVALPWLLDLNESSSETSHLEMYSVYRFNFMQIKLIFI